MNTYTYHSEIRIILTALETAFAGVILKRTNANLGKETIDNIAVPVKYGTKQRVLHDLINTSQHIKLPIFTFSLRSITYDAERAFNKLDGFYTSKDIGLPVQKYPQPMPVSMSIDTSFLSRFQGDCDQYITNLFINAQPYFIISYKHPDVNIEVRCKVIWDGNINLNYPTDLDATKAYRTEVDASFKVEGWIYKNTNAKSGLIYNIPLNFTSLSELSENYYIMKDQESAPDRTDNLVVSGRPVVRGSDVDTLFSYTSGNELVIDGNQLDTVTGIVLTGAEHVFDEEMYDVYDFYSQDHTLSATCPEVTGVTADFEIVNPTHIRIELPEFTTSGSFDVVALGRYGMGWLSRDSYRDYMTEQLPVTGGIRVL